MSRPVVTRTTWGRNGSRKLIQPRLLQQLSKLAINHHDGIPRLLQVGVAIVNRGHAGDLAGRVRQQLLNDRLLNAERGHRRTEVPAQIVQRPVRNPATRLKIQQTLREGSVGFSVRGGEDQARLFAVAASHQPIVQPMQVNGRRCRNHLQVCLP